jgi:ribosomal protein L20
LAKVELNRKQLSELAISSPEVFSEIVEISKEGSQRGFRCLMSFQATNS